MIGLYKDPTGINVFDNRYSSPNYDENDIVALRRDVQQLRVTLHFAQVSFDETYDKFPFTSAVHRYSKPFVQS